MDTKDGKILEILQENAKLSTQQISKKTLIPITTVHNRIKKLERQGIIKGYTVKLNYSKLNKGLSAYILITVDYKYLKEHKTSQHELLKKMQQHPFVEHGAMITGGNDIIIKVRVKNMTEMDEFVTTVLRNYESIDRTQTLVVLHETD